MEARTTADQKIVSDGRGVTPAQSKKKRKKTSTPPKPTEARTPVRASVRKHQLSIHRKARENPRRRFQDLYAQLSRQDVLESAFEIQLANDWRAHVDGDSLALINSTPEMRQEWLESLQDELESGSYQSGPLRIIVDKRDGEKLRGVPPVKDRVLQTAACLLLMPIFEADFQQRSQRFLPRLPEHQAIDAIYFAVQRGYIEIIHADVSKYVDLTPHRVLMRAVTKRISDPDLLRLIKGWLRADIVEEHETIYQPIPPRPKKPEAVSRFSPGDESMERGSRFEDKLQQDETPKPEPALEITLEQEKEPVIERNATPLAEPDAPGESQEQPTPIERDGFNVAQLDSVLQKKETEEQETEKENEEPAAEPVEEQPRPFHQRFFSGLMAICHRLAGKNSGSDRATAHESFNARIEYIDPTAHEVCLAGSFNDWHSEPMTRSDDGKWSKGLSLQPGNYEYQFIVDGRWQLDPTAESQVANPFGGTNSLLVVKEAERSDQELASSV